VKEPIGVVAGVVPWNFPLMMAVWKAAPALATGCSVIIKPAEDTPLTAIRVAQIAKEAGIPDGVFNVVPGFGDVGEALGRHNDVDAVSFTGSTEVGGYFMKYSGESNLKTGMESAQKELAGAIESGDASAQVEANKRIATLAFDNAKLEQAKANKPVAQEPVQLSDGGRLPQQTPQSLPEPDPQAEAWASKNTWFGKDRAMTFTAFEIHKDLVNEGFDPKSDNYYSEVDKRIKVDFPHKFAIGGDVEQTSKTNQLVASAQRSVRPGRKTVRLTSSQVAIAKKLGVPLEEYAKQIKLTEGA